jgi:mannose-6-phosphate isomerase
VDERGNVLDARALLYDQAFVLLALAECQKILGQQPSIIEAADSLRSILYARLKRSGAGFRSALPDVVPLLSNPHMHLLEAALSWTSASENPAWQRMADEIVALALDYLIDRSSGLLREQFSEDWAPLESVSGRIVEPGHFFEWAWLLLRCTKCLDPRLHGAAATLIRIGETYGVREGVVVNALLDDLSVFDREARLWPQTERLKAAARISTMNELSGSWSNTAQAGETLLRYLRTDVSGLWHDRLDETGQFLIEPSPASSFYHIVCAALEVDSALAPPLP